jgi:hypothetical protein
MKFSIEGADADKAALIQTALQQFHLNINRDVASKIADVLRFGASHGANFGGGNIVGEEGRGMLTVGARALTHYVLPDEFNEALKAIGAYFQRE